MDEDFEGTVRSMRFHSLQLKTLSAAYNEWNQCMLAHTKKQMQPQ